MTPFSTLDREGDASGQQSMVVNRKHIVLSVVALVGVVIGVSGFLASEPTAVAKFASAPGARTMNAASHSASVAKPLLRATLGRQSNQVNFGVQSFDRRAEWSLGGLTASMASLGFLVTILFKVGQAAHGRYQSQQQVSELTSMPHARAPAPQMAFHLCHGARATERRSWLSDETKAQLESVVAHIGQPGKGISACDESYRTIDPRFENVGQKSSEEVRRAYRQMLFEAEGANENVCAVILDPETVFQKDDNGTPFPKMLTEKGMLPGVKPTLTAYALPGCDGETVMQGLDNLAERLKEWKAAGCVFAKWRSPFYVDIAAGKPSMLAIEANMRDQARYALICQGEGIVPIVEPDVVLKGEHTLEDAIEINAQILRELYAALIDHGVHLDGTILKVNMVNPGKDCKTKYSLEDIADANLQTLRRTLPVGVRSVNYLSGGQTLDESASILDAINKMKIARGGDRYAPWNLSFSWSACIQMPLFELCRDSSLERDANGLPIKAMAKLYVENMTVASTAAKGTLQMERAMEKVGA